MAIPILAIVFTGIIILSLIDNHYAMKKRKLDTELREAEMRAGVAPGTYSGKSKDKKKHKFSAMKEEFDQAKAEAKDEDEERAALLKGIEDLKKRIDNIDTIMQSRKAEEEKK